MSKDKIYGGLILIVSVVLIIWYTYWALYYGCWIGSQIESMVFAIPALNTVYFGSHAVESFFYSMFGPGLLQWIPTPPKFLAVGVPIWLAITAILGIAAWIGWTMLTTPPPVPLEELEAEEEKKEEEKEEEKEAKKTKKAKK